MANVVCCEYDGFIIPQIATVHTKLKRKQAKSIVTHSVKCTRCIPAILASASHTDASLLSKIYILANMFF